jgi:hypothetical protein
MEAIPVKVIPVKIQPRGFGETRRRDWWWIEPMIVVIVFSSFLGYGTWAALQNAHFEYGPYLSPFYSPLLWGTSHHAWFETIAAPAFWPPFLAFSPALFILPFPGLFRFTCYYYRGAYYKAFWGDPISCTVGEPRGTSYWGERWLPLVLQNAHRYAAYVALLFIVILSYDVWLALWWETPDGGTELGIGVGTLVMLANVLLIAGYTLGCHSLRHLFGGRKDEISKSPISHACYNCSSALNARHMLFAWCSLFSVGLTDAYIRLCSMGILTDVRLL